jgi:hypothetical protein
MRIDTSGNVGIGTTGPIKPLSVEITSARSATTDNEAIRVSYGTNSGVQQSVAIGFATGVSNTYPAAKIELLEFDAVDARGSLLFYTRDANSDTAPTERMRIDTSGYVRVNNTGGLDGQLSSLTGAWYAGAFANTSVAYPTAYSWSKATSGDNLFYQFFTEAGATSRGTIDYNRGAGLVRYNTTSDATLKNIIGDSDGAKSVEILNSTRIREFAWKDDETQKPQIGVIAQELYETYKGAVSVGGDVEKERDVTEEVEEEYTDENGETQTRTVTKVVGKETYTEYRPWGVDKTAFTFHLVAGWQAHEKMIQELKAINDAQAQRIETLEANNAALEARITAIENGA